MVLSDHDINLALGMGRLKISPMPKPQDIQPASVDVHLGEGFRVLDTGVILDTRKPCEEFFKYQESDNGLFTVYPGQLVLAQIAERLILPDDIACQVGGRSSLARLGLFVHVTAGWVDCGWDGNLTLELVNGSGNPINIHVGDRIAQLIFLKVLSPSERLYSGKYQGSNQVECSRSYQDLL